MLMFDGAQEAFVGNLAILLRHGEDVTVRGQKTKELLSHVFQIRDPLRRVILAKHRNGNIFAQIAETMWMLAGQNDLDWLERYIPQCKKFSDDGKTWRAAYGPRLRRWVGTDAWQSGRTTYMPGYWMTDQLTETISRLRKDPQTRQAVISLWDPATDNAEQSLDYPCNNWLHFIIRDNKLHLNVAVRSNDAIYGFSHADFFGWSVLQQFVATSLNIEVGTMTWFATSYHLYEKHFEMAEKIVNSSCPLNDGSYITADTVYNHGIKVPDMFIGEVDMSWFHHVLEIEKLSRTSIPDAWDVIRTWEHDTRDEFFATCVVMLVFYNEYVHATKEHAAGFHPDDWVQDFAFRVASMPSSDMKMAAIEFFVRKIPNFVDHIHEYVLGSEKLFLISKILG